MKLQIFKHPFVILALASSIVTCDITLAKSHNVKTTGSDKPNVIIIFADDMGYGDMSNAGHPTIKTPNLDQMAAEGQKWTNFYSAASICTPSRAGLLTGRLPIRSGMASSQKWVLFEDSPGGLPQEELTIAEALKEQGYQTAMVGKWHLGHLSHHLPTNHGFDSWFGIPYSNDMDRNEELVTQANNGKEIKWYEGTHWSQTNSEHWNVPLMEGEAIIERAPDQSQLTKKYTKRAMKFIKENKEKPFFLYLAHNMPHVPLFASPQFKGKSTAGIYGDVIEEIDWSVGEILKTLKEQGIAENTLVIFTSDNGPWKLFKTHGGSSGMLTGQKGNTYEGGMREPTVMWWPGKIKPAIVHEIGSTLDLLPTIVNLAGGDVPNNLDGYDLAPIFNKGQGSQRNEIIYYRGTEIYAIRMGAYKAHFFSKHGFFGEKIVHATPLLFDLNVDPGEHYNISVDHPEIIEQILAFKTTHEKTIVPVVNQLERTNK